MSTAGFTNDNYIVQVSPLLELERAALPHDEAAASTFVKRRLASPGRGAPAVAGWPRTSSISEHACRLVARCRPGSGLVDPEAQVNRFMEVMSVSIHIDEDAPRGATLVEELSMKAVTPLTRLSALTLLLLGCSSGGVPYPYEVTTSTAHVRVTVHVAGVFRVQLSRSSRTKAWPGSGTT